jgi:hypothetical protein
MSPPSASTPCDARRIENGFLFNMDHLSIRLRNSRPGVWGELEMARHRQIAASLCGKIALRNYGFDEPTVVRAESPHECSHTHF